MNRMMSAVVAVAAGVWSVCAAGDVVKASDFGLSGDDATKCLQAFLDSGSKVVRVGRQAGDRIVSPCAEGAFVYNGGEVPRSAYDGIVTAKERCARIFETAIRDGIIHGAAVVAGNADGSDIIASWGWADAAHTVPMTPSTVIDVASVTKVAAGITACLVAHARGSMDIDEMFAERLPAYSARSSENVSIRDLANHVSGFGEADGKPRVYFDDDPRKMIRNVLTMPPGIPERGKVRYSCRNYIILGQLFECVTGCAAEDFCKREIFLPAGMKDTSLGAPVEGIGRDRLAQTMGADCPGTISDSVARPLWAEGIGTFNAGLFSTAEDLARLMRVYLRGGVCDNGTRLFGKTEMKLIAPDPKNRTEGARAFGWVYASEDLPESLCGTALFHSGWTGQTVLFDLKRRRYAVVLTTRCGNYARAKKDRFKAVAALIGK